MDEIICKLDSSDIRLLLKLIAAKISDLYDDDCEELAELEELKEHLVDAKNEHTKSS